MSREAHTRDAIWQKTFISRITDTNFYVVVNILRDILFVIFFVQSTMYETSPKTDNFTVALQEKNNQIKLHIILLPQTTHLILFLCPKIQSANTLLRPTIANSKLFTTSKLHNKQQHPPKLENRNRSTSLTKLWATSTY